jgi:hypothetical protein
MGTKSTTSQKREVTEQIGKMKRQFNRAVRRSRGVIFAERLWIRAAPSLGVIGLFLTASWAGVWKSAPPELRIAGVAAFTLSALAAPMLCKTGSLRVKKKEAIDRLDENSGDPTNPAGTISDKLDERSTPQEQKLWDLHQLNVWDKHGSRLKAGCPQPNLGKYDRFGLRYFITAAAIGSAIIAGDDLKTNLTQAFNWKSPPVVAELPPPLSLRATITPPDGIEAYPVYLTEKSLDHTQGGKRLRAHEKSMLTIMTMGRKAKITVNEKQLELKRTINPHAEDKNKLTYQYEIQLEDEDAVVSIEDGPRWHIMVTPDNPPRMVIKNIRLHPDNPHKLIIDVESEDDFGLAEGKVRMRVANQNPDAKPLPSGALPGIYLSR